LLGWQSILGLINLALHHLSISDTISILYKRPFRKEKEVVTFLMSLLKWILAINGEAPSQVRGLNAHSSLAQ
jgi:hypothetical protein